MKKHREKNGIMASCCKEDDDVCDYRLKCDGKDDICITSPQCLETGDSGSESDDVPPETNTKVFRMRRRSSVECTLNDIDTLANWRNGKNKGNCKKCLKKTCSCVKNVRDCPSTSTSVRPTTPTTTPGAVTLLTTPQPVQTSTTSPATSRSTTIRTTTQTVSTNPPSSASTSTIQTYPSSLSTTLRVRTSTTVSTPRVRRGNQDELSMLDTSSIIGIAIGSLAFLVLIILIAIILHRKRKAYKMAKNTSQKSNVENNPHYFTVEEFPNNQYEEINDVGIPTPTDDYNILGEDNSVMTNHFDNYNHISPAVVTGQVGLGSDGYNHVVLANGSPPKILDNDYNHISFETGAYNQLKGHNSFKNPKAESYHHILRPSDNEGKM